MIHLDVDCFFVQCERARDPSLIGQPVVVQQHQDIIAVSYEARSLGIKKHSVPNELRREHPQCRVVHAPTTDTGKVTYHDYRQYSKRICDALRTLVQPPGVVEIASIDGESMLPVVVAVTLTFIPGSCRLLHRTPFG